MSAWPRVCVTGKYRESMGREQATDVPQLWLVIIITVTIKCNTPMGATTCGVVGGPDPLKIWTDPPSFYVAF